MLDEIYHEELVKEILEEARSLDNDQKSTQLSRIECLALVIIKYVKENKNVKSG